MQEALRAKRTLEDGNKDLQGKLSQVTKTLEDVKKEPKEIHSPDNQGTRPRANVESPAAHADPPPLVADLVRMVQENIPSNHDDAKYAIRVTLQSDREIKQPMIEIECDSPISYAEVNAGTSAMMGSPTNLRGTTTFRFSTTFPSLAPAQPYTVIISAQQSIHAVNVRRIY